MPTLIQDRRFEKQLRRERAASGADRYDEVWDGVYVMSPLADIEHQQIVGGLHAILQIVIKWSKQGEVFPGCNISDRDEDWTRNYRIPEIAVYLNDNRALFRDTHVVGGPDLAVEITSPDERPRAKLPFYAKVATREVLLLDRKRWRLELYRLDGRKLVRVGRSTPDDPAPLASATVPLTFRLVAGQPRPTIDVAHADGAQRWTV
jgi:Uma2 family endonuclease